MTTDAVLRREEVPAAFDAGAAAYDRLVGANPGYHAHLRLSARRMRLPGDGRGLRLLDAGCGTGASTAALLTAAPHAEIVAIDASAQMLAQARAKAWPSSVRFVHARVEDLADAGVRGPFDGILAAYLIRNLADPDGQLRALRDLLRPGGTLAVHEYSVRDSAPGPRGVERGVLERHHPVRPAGHRRRQPVPLLWRSVEGFDGVRRFRAAAARGRVHRGAQRDHDRLAARRGAHLPGHARRTVAPGPARRRTARGPGERGGRPGPAGGTAPGPGRRAGCEPAARAAARGRRRRRHRGPGRRGRAGRARGAGHGRRARAVPRRPGGRLDGTSARSARRVMAGLAATGPPCR